jgi:hypothetical protein
MITTPSPEVVFAIVIAILVGCGFLARYVSRQDFRRLFAKLGYTALDTDFAPKLFPPNLTIFTTKGTSFLGERFKFKWICAASLNLLNEDVYYAQVFHAAGGKHGDRTTINAVIIKTDFNLPYVKMQNSYRVFSRLKYLNKPLFEAMTVNLPFEKYNFYTDMANPDSFLDFFTGDAPALFKKENLNIEMNGNFIAVYKFGGSAHTYGVEKFIKTTLPVALALKEYLKENL